ncbi:hypothetical protein [Sphingomonas sp. GB1N7]|uniref:hypothetical protein n=1 Tax=Parasphingomonas caseinilytica TaxID=3096158 RepID=UPI002FCC410A
MQPDSPAKEGKITKFHEQIMECTGEIEHAFQTPEQLGTFGPIQPRCHSVAIGEGALQLGDVSAGNLVVVKQEQEVQERLISEELRVQTEKALQLAIPVRPGFFQTVDRLKIRRKPALKVSTGKQAVRHRVMPGHIEFGCRLGEDTANIGAGDSAGVQRCRKVAANDADQGSHLNQFVECGPSLRFACCNRTVAVQSIQIEGSLDWSGHARQYEIHQSACLELRQDIIDCPLGGQGRHRSDRAHTKASRTKVAASATLQMLT